MKRPFCFLLGLLLTGILRVHAQIGPAPGATLTRDVWGDTWFPEWNTDKDPTFAQGYRNTVAIDPHPGTWSALGNRLSVTKDIQGLGEGRWHQTAILVFADDGSGQWVRFGSWMSAGDGKSGIQTIDFNIPAWAQGKIKWEVWAWYGAASDITNFQYNPLTRKWVNHLGKSHLAVAFGETGINIESIKPTQLLLRASTSNPSAGVTASNSSVSVGNPILFTLRMVGGINSEITFSGGGIDLSDPPNSISTIARSLGLQKYSLTVPGYVTLQWDAPRPGNIVILHTPRGNVDVTHFASYIVSSTSAGAGLYSVTQTTRAGLTSDPQPLSISLPRSSIADAQVNIVAPASAVTVSPQSASYTIHDGPAAGRSFPRSWNDGSNWHAYLGRDGVAISVDATNSDSAIASIELQAKTPTGDWADLVAPQSVDASVPNGAGVKVSQRFSVRLGSVRADKPLVPSDTSLAGVWQLRARALTSTGTWGEWSVAVPLTVEMPLKSVNKIGQTLPPIKDAAWFTASATETYNISLWIP